jgi:hypothetical protein
MRLRELQAHFLAALTGAAAGAPAPLALLGMVRGTPALAAEARLAIYTDMYAARLVDVLREDYPRVAHVLGDERFGAVVRAYLVAHPSRHPSVRWVGDRFAAFAASHTAAAAWPWLGDLARLEWARGEVFDAPDAPPLGLERLKAEPPARWGALPLEAIPALRTLSSAWPVHEAWAAAEAEVAAPALRPAPTTLRIWRHDFVVYHAAMGPVEEAALVALRAGGGFGAVCETVTERVPAASAPREAGALLLRWIEDGILADLPPAP